MEKQGCLFCEKQRRSYNWSGADIDGAHAVAPGGFIKIIEILEDPFFPSRYSYEEVIQCDVCNSIWDIIYFYPDHPPQTINAERIDPDMFETFFDRINAELKNRYTSQK